MNLFEDDSRQVAAELGRHPSLHRVCGSLHSIIVAERALEILEDTSVLPRRAGLWIPPSWMWAYPKIHVGHKGFNSDGERVRLPVRVTWSSSPIGIVPNGDHEMPWSYAGMGNTAVGVSEVEAGNGLTDEFIPDGNEVPLIGRVGVHYKSELVRLLEEKVALGKEARWGLMMMLEGYVQTAVDTAHRYVSAEVSPNGAPVLDATSREQLVTTLMYGDLDSDPSDASMVLRMLDRCTQPSTFVKVDPWRYMREAVASAAETAIRRQINDPHIGRKIRKVAEEIGTRDVDTVLDAYRERYPQDGLARKRAEAALNAGSDAMATWVGLPELTEPGERP